MAEYSYLAAKHDGKTVKGTLVAGSPDMLKDNLRRQQLYLLEYDEIKKAGGKRLKATQLADFCRELSSMLGTGVSLVRAMQIIMNRDLSPAMKTTFTALNQQIKRGIALSEAMEMQDEVFPELLISMVKAGEANGKLDEALKKMASHYEAEHRTNQDIKGAMTYPIILIVITILVIIAVFTFIFTRLMTVFGDMELPTITQVMMGISNFLTQQWFMAIVIVLAVGIAIYWITRLEKVKYGWDKFIVKLPKIGPLLKIIYTARFARTFSSLYSGGLTILNALQISKDTIGNRYIAGQFDGVIRMVRQGTSLSEALAAVDGFDVKLTETIAVGEETGRVDELLLSIADSFDYESSMAIKKLVKLIEPIMILIMALVILTVMLSVMLPIYELYGNIDQTEI
ncbi:MAG: type II secretion system F family protein [Oscillospiraceae bacterium]|nr:type II secretion system F family protein [Oscillospiraceae bacterium]